MRRRILISASAVALLGLALPLLAQQSDVVFADGFEAPVNFRFTSLALRDPHAFLNFIGCRDITDDTSLGGFSINGNLQASIQGDGDNDGYYDLSYLQSFRPLDQRDGASGPSTLTDAACTASPPTSCVAGSNVQVASTYTTQLSGSCLTFIAGTVRPYVPAITGPGAPCFSTSAASVTLNLAGIAVPLQGARIGATYVGNPATTLVSGLLTGFVAESDADNIVVPASFPLVGGQPLSSLLPGGTGNCAPFSDKDVSGGVSGWQFYLNFTAEQVQ